MTTINSKNSWDPAEVHKLISDTLANVDAGSVTGMDTAYLHDPLYATLLTAQALHESGVNLQSGLARSHNNLFGMGNPKKRETLKSGYVILKDNITGKEQEFSTFDCAEDSIYDRILWDIDRDFYPANAQDYVDSVCSVPYGTDSRYKEKWVEIINQLAVNTIDTNTDIVQAEKKFSISNILAGISIFIGVISLLKK